MSNPYLRALPYRPTHRLMDILAKTERRNLIPSLFFTRVGTG